MPVYTILIKSPPFLRHWRYISDYSGPWLTFTPTVTKTLTWTNYTKSLPRFVDNGMCFDLIRIREMVDKAIHLSIGATMGVMPSGPGSAQTSDGRSPQMSAVRRHRLRVEAVHHLAQAYALDDIATSLFVIQSASALEDLPRLVLERAPDNRNAQYVHFFHEKIPNQQLLQTTHPAVLDPIVESDPRNPAVWRTRGVVRMLKADYEGAVTDLTESLRLSRMSEIALFNKRRIMAEEAERETAVAEGDTNNAGEKNPESDSGTTRPKNDQEKIGMPSAEKQVRFQRAQAYLAMACQCIYAALGPEWVKHEKWKLRVAQKSAYQKTEAATRRTADDAIKGASLPKQSTNGVIETQTTASNTPNSSNKDVEDGGNADNDDGDDDDDDDDNGGATLLADEPLEGVIFKGRPLAAETPSGDTLADEDQDDDEQSKEQRKEQLRIQRQMRMYTKRAIRDFLSFLSSLDYAPNMAIHTGETFIRRVVQLAVNRSNSGSSSWLLSHGMATMKELKARREQQPHATLNDPPDLMDDEAAMVLPMSALLDGTPMPDLPTYPRPILARSIAPSSTTPGEAPEDKPSTLPTTEAATFHPLLSNVLHSLLLCHCLILTSPSELTGHMNMIARLTSLADGYPFFQKSPCTTRQDWIEVLHRAGGPGWAKLPDGVSWDEYSAPSVPPSSSGKDSTTHNMANNTNMLPLAPASVSPRAQAISYWILENMRLNGGVIKERPMAEGEDGPSTPAPAHRPKGKKKSSRAGATAGP